jgi:hypothetical protein
MTSDERDGQHLYAIKDPEINTGRITEVDEGWLLNPLCTASITLLSSTFERAQAVKRVLEQSYNQPNHSVQELAVLIVTHGLVFKELRGGPKTRSHGKAQILQFGHSLRLFGPAGP